MASEHPSRYGNAPERHPNSTDRDPQQTPMLSWQEEAADAAHDSPHEPGLNDLSDFIERGWLRSCGLDGPAFLWNRSIGELSKQDDGNRVDGPVASMDQARTMMATPIEWYFQAIADTTPTAVRTERGYDIPKADMPTFRLESQALAGVEAVVGNALMSSRWIDAANNLAEAVGVAASFIGNIADRDDEGFDFLRSLIRDVRVYFDSLARHADVLTSDAALRSITRVACSDEFRLNPMQMVELLSCGLSFAQWDDTRVLAYDAIGQALATMQNMELSARDEQDDDPATSLFEDAAGGLIDYPIEEIHERFEQSMLFLRHDLLRISGETQEADRFLLDHLDCEPLADAYAARLVSQERWEELLEVTTMVAARNPNQQLTMIPEHLVPYEWESIRELALSALGRSDELCVMYRRRIVEAFSSEEIGNVALLREVSGDDWQRQRRLVVTEYDDGIGRFTRNPAYEHLLISEKLGIEAWRYSLQFPKARAGLAKTISYAKPDQARRIILGHLHTDGSYDDRLPTHLAIYHHIAKSLHTYASVFGMDEARGIAASLVARYPGRRTLAAVLHDFLH